MSVNWVMLSSTGEIVKLPHERILHKAGPRVGLKLSVPSSVPSALERTEPFFLQSDNGTTYITTQRLIYIPAKPTSQFKSFATPILHVEDSFVASPWFGSWYWKGLVKPVSSGGIPPEIPRVELKLVFKDGGHSEFREKFENLKEQLHHLRELEQESGHPLAHMVPTDEPLPAYEPPQAISSTNTSRNHDPESLSPPPPPPPSHSPHSLLAQSDMTPQRSNSSASNTRAPEEPPPAYEEAQAQTLTMRLEDHIRNEAVRDL